MGIAWYVEFPGPAKQQRYFYVLQSNNKELSGSAARTGCYHNRIIMAVTDARNKRKTAMTFVGTVGIGQIGRK